MTDTLRADLVRLRDEMQNDRHWAVLTGWVNKLDAILAAHPAEEEARGTTPPVPTCDTCRHIRHGRDITDEGYSNCALFRFTIPEDAPTGEAFGCTLHAATAGEERK